MIIIAEYEKKVNAFRELNYFTIFAYNRKWIDFFHDAWYNYFISI